MLLVAKRYLNYLKQIDKTYNHMERQLYKSQRNKELIQLLDLEKSLVYFNTSLKANEVTLEKIPPGADRHPVRGGPRPAGGRAHRGASGH